MKLAIFSFLIGTQFNQAFIPSQIGKFSLNGEPIKNQLYSNYLTNSYKHHEENKSPKILQVELENKFTGKIEDSLSRAHLLDVSIKYSKTKILKSITPKKAADVTQALLEEASPILDSELIERLSDLSRSMVDVSGESFLMNHLDNGMLLFFYVSSARNIEQTHIIQYRIIQSNPVSSIDDELSPQINALNIKRIDLVGSFIDGEISSDEYEIQMGAISEEIDSLKRLWAEPNGINPNCRDDL